MPTFHHTVRIHGRSARAGRRSAEQSVAYVNAQLIYSPRYDAWYDHRNKKDVVATDVRLPKTAPRAWRNPANLARAVEAAESRRDAQLLREIECQLPSEAVVWKPNGEYAVQDEALELVKEHADDLVGQGMAVIVAVHLNVKRSHDPETGAPIEIPRPGVHLLATLREVTPDGGLGRKRRDWNDPALYRALRHMWEDRLNEFLARLDSPTRVTRHAYRAFGLPVDGSVKLGRAPFEPVKPPHRGFLVLDRLGEEYALTEWRRSGVHARVADTNAALLLDNPGLAVSMAAVWKAPGAELTRRDIKRILHTHTRTHAQYLSVLEAVDRRFEPVLDNDPESMVDHDGAVIARAGEGSNWSVLRMSEAIEPEATQPAPQADLTRGPSLIVRPDVSDGDTLVPPYQPGTPGDPEVCESVEQIAVFGPLTDENVVKVLERAHRRGWFDVALECPEPDGPDANVADIIRRGVARACDEGIDINVTVAPCELQFEQPKPP